MDFEIRDSNEGFDNTQIFRKREREREEIGKGERETYCTIKLFCGEIWRELERDLNGKRS